VVPSEDARELSRYGNRSVANEVQTRPNTLLPAILDESSSVDSLARLAWL
jgi:hypothetical protein